MGKRGPAPSTDAAQRATPAQRTKADRAAKHSARVAALLAPQAAAADLPPMLQDPKYAPAAQVWRRLAPELKRTSRLPVESEFHLVQLCIYAQEWVSQTEDLHDKGFAQRVKTVAGGSFERRRPAIFDRQQAFQNCLELSGRFGLTPTDMYALFKDQRMAVDKNPDMFDRQRAQHAASAPAPDEPDDDEAAAPTPTSRVGAFGRLRSTPPAVKPN